MSAASGALLNSTLLVLTGPWPLVVVYVVCRDTLWLSMKSSRLSSSNRQACLTPEKSSTCALELVHGRVPATKGGIAAAWLEMAAEAAGALEPGNSSVPTTVHQRVVSSEVVSLCLKAAIGQASGCTHEVVGDGEAHVEGEAEDEDVAWRVLVRVLHLAETDRGDQAEHDAEQARHHGLRQRREQAAELACAADRLGGSRISAALMQPAPSTEQVTGDQSHSSYAC